MKRIIFGLLILTLVLSVFATSTISAFAEGEDVGTENTGTEETLPEGDGTGEGGEELPPENEGTEDGGENLPSDGEGTENGGEDVPSEGDGTEDGGEDIPPEGEGNEEGGEELPPEDGVTEEGTQETTEEELSASEELFALVGQLGDELKGMFKDLWNFIASNDTYKNIATAILGVLACILIPFLIALAVIAYIAMAVIIWVVGALMSLVEAIIGMVMGATFIA